MGTYGIMGMFIYDFSMEKFEKSKCWSWFEDDSRKTKVGSDQHHLGVEIEGAATSGSASGLGRRVIPWDTPRIAGGETSEWLKHWTRKKLGEFLRTWGFLFRSSSLIHWFMLDHVGPNVQIQMRSFVGHHEETSQRPNLLWPGSTVSSITFHPTGHPNHWAPWGWNGTYPLVN